MKELQPLNEFVMLDVTQDNAEQKTTSGIIIPDTAKEKPVFGKVAGIGNIENSGISVGDTVVYKKYSGTEIEYESKNFLFIPYADVLAKVVETESI